MKFALILDYAGLEYYGHIPVVPYPPDSRVEVFYFEDEENDLLLEDFVPPINQACGTLLDDGDLDYFDQAKCTILKSWLEERLPNISSDILVNLYRKLLEFAARAIELNTGVVVEL
ncbi:MAG: hypothetical protein MJY85_06675 [Fibrobacter sp.]|nr:hypothetical protein [Fibrobacter sp.]MCQ2123101.1 hypothetical protein [Fibrobacter sp.]